MYSSLFRYRRKKNYVMKKYKILGEIKKITHKFTFYECFLADKTDMVIPNKTYRMMVPWLMVDSLYLIVSMQIAEDIE